MAKPLWISNLLGTRASSFTVRGDLRTRDSNTGGGDVFSRSFLAAPAGFYYITDASGNRVGFMGPDGAPATYFTFGGGTGPVGSGADPLSIEIATGKVIVPALTTTTQAAHDNSTKAATTAYADAGAAAALAAALGADITYTDTGITITGGAKDGSVIDPSLISAESSSISPANYAYPTGGSTWSLWVYPTPASGTFELDVRKRSLGNTAPGSGDSICASAKPSLTGNGSTLTATGSLSTWTGSPLSKGSMLTVRPATNTAGVKWWVLFIPARRAF